MTATKKSPETANGEQLPKEEKQFLDYLDQEIADLEARESRLAHLRSIRATMQGQSTNAGSATAPRRQRRKDRLAEFVGLVAEKPGQKIADYARMMEAAPNYLYRLVSRAEAEKQVRREDGKVFPGEGVQAS